MPETFPSAPRSSGLVRLTALGIGLVGLALALRVTATSLAVLAASYQIFVRSSHGFIEEIGN